MFTAFRDDPADGRYAQFNLCYFPPGTNACFDGDTISVAGQCVEIAGSKGPGLAIRNATRSLTGDQGGNELAVLLTATCDRGDPFLAPSDAGETKTEKKN